jgi:hypothetical protein
MYDIKRLCASQARLAAELGIDGSLVFTVRENAAIILTRQQVRAKHAHTHTHTAAYMPIPHVGRKPARNLHQRPSSYCKTASIGTHCLLPVHGACCNM